QVRVVLVIRDCSRKRCSAWRNCRDSRSISRFLLIALHEPFKRFLIVIERYRILTLPKIEIAQLIMRGCHAAVVLGSGVEVEGVAQLNERLVCLPALQESFSFAQSGAGITLLRGRCGRCNQQHNGERNSNELLSKTHFTSLSLKKLLEDFIYELV